jgi:hypothetical protein
MRVKPKQKKRGCAGDISIRYESDRIMLLEHSNIPPTLSDTAKQDNNPHISRVMIMTFDKLTPSIGCVSKSVWLRSKLTYRVASPRIKVTPMVLFKTLHV